MHNDKTTRLDHYMREALSRYYDSRDPLGGDGDFTTAPEISQLFGEIIGIWAVQKWQAMGCPHTINLIEIGPGRGTLMADLLRGTKQVAPFHNAINIHLVEMSSTLRQKQQENLCNYNVQWHEHLNEITPSTPSIIIANEFFDALPVRQFKYHDQQQWLEHDIHKNNSLWTAIETPPVKSTLPHPSHGDIYEYSEDQKQYAELINKFHGAFLIIDYGYLQSSYGDSLQALYKHKPCKITDHFGDADLTTHIDFEWLASFFTQTQITLGTQADFLRHNGIDLRYQMLRNPTLKGGYDRLMNPDQMGDLFKVMEVVKPSVKTG